MFVFCWNTVNFKVILMKNLEFMIKYKLYRVLLLLSFVKLTKYTSNKENTNIFTIVSLWNHIQNDSFERKSIVLSI